MSDATQGVAGARGHRWRFFRSGGFDQVRLESADDLRNLTQLDQKLWAALACPVVGVEFDTKTLALLDVDNDGRIRVPEVLGAVQWACSVLKDPGDLTRCADGLPLEAIDASSPEGQRLLDSARQTLANLGKPEATIITAEDTADTTRIFAQTRLNGDGVVPPEAADDPAVRAAIEDVIRCVGSVADRGGAQGVSQALVDTFFDEAQTYADWWSEASGNPDLRPLGEKTEAAADLFESLKPKIDDYFTRCRLASFDPRAADPLNPPVAGYEALSATSLSASAAAVAALPLARVEAGRPLPLAEGINPAWADTVARLRKEVVEPILGPRTTLAAEDWDALCAKLAAYEAWLARKKGQTVEALGLARVRELLATDSRAAISALIASDKALESAAGAIASVDRLVRYYRDLYTLLNNFVSFRDFYTGRKKAIFQAGTLYLDGRSCGLCVRIEDIGKHSTLANLSRTYLAYCECTRRGSGERMTIAAAFTAGDADNLLVGRNGVFYDRKGQDWDATIVKILEHPISVSQAFWAPYKRVARMIGEQIEKMAGAREKAVQEKAAAGITDVSGKVETGKPAAPAQPFDVAKFAGIFAAIGLAIGAIGTAIASVVTGFMGLKLWQMPLAVGGLILAVSGPSMVIAYLKLRQRNLAPILDANGWAVNTLAKINIPFGGSLTDTAKLPPGAERSLSDPFAEKKRPWKTYAVIAALVGLLGWLGYQGYLAQWVRELLQATQHAAQQAEQQAAPAAQPPAAEGAKPAASPPEAVKPAAAAPEPSKPAPPAPAEAARPAAPAEPAPAPKAEPDPGAEAKPAAEPAAPPPAKAAEAPVPAAAEVKPAEATRGSEPKPSAAKAAETADKAAASAARAAEKAVKPRPSEPAKATAE
jgi:hypothetical protein